MNTQGRDVMTGLPYSQVQISTLVIRYELTLTEGRRENRLSRLTLLSIRPGMARRRLRANVVLAMRYASSRIQNR